ncbi:hypothetical protein [Brevundimonas diminuta]|uniref:hypothetical protein n=1 Tax=Brevundimonas diminuta TaxID=293 RepID=UPI00320B162E
MKRFGLIALATTLAGCASQGTTTHTLAGVTADRLFADIENCQAMGRTGAQSTPSGTAHNPALASPAGAAFGAGFAEGLAKAQAQNAIYERCMGERGYRKVTLTPEERAAFRGLRSVDQRKLWIAEFATRDHGERAAAYIPPICKPSALVSCPVD